MRPLRLFAVALALSAVAALAGCTTKVEVAQGRWLATCDNVILVDCEGIAELFVNNLARDEEGIRKAAGGMLFVASIGACPELPEWALPQCWRAFAPIEPDRACMVIARQNIAAGSGFGQVGGDEYTGLAGEPEPGTNPC
jgi:hypothetical protein